MKNFFPDNWVLSIFAEKSNKEFVFLEKDNIVWKKKMSWIFRRQVRRNQTKITAGKICLMKTENNRYSQNFWRILKNFSENISFIVSRRCPKRRKNPSSISAEAREIIEKTEV